MFEHNTQDTGDRAEINERTKKQRNRDLSATKQH